MLTHNVVFIISFQLGDFEQGHSEVGMLFKGILFLSYVTVWPNRYKAGHMLCSSLCLTLQLLDFSGLYRLLRLSLQRTDWELLSSVGPNSTGASATLSLFFTRGNEHNPKIRYHTGRCVRYDCIGIALLDDMTRTDLAHWTRSTETICTLLVQ